MIANVRFGIGRGSTRAERIGQRLELWLFSALLAACGDTGSPVPGSVSRGRELALEPSSGTSPRDPALPADDYTLFEADPVRPVAVLASSGLVAVANTFDDFVELVRPVPGGELTRCGGARVGLRPVALAVVDDRSDRAELWVVNHLSDSISVLEVDPEACTASLVETLHVGDEPRDIVVAVRGDGQRSAFVATAHRGQHHPVDGARSGLDSSSPAGEKEHAGLADVFVFDTSRRVLRDVVNLFSDTPRALAVGDGVVYAAGFLTGNRTTSVMAERVLARGSNALAPLLLRQGGGLVEQAGELLLAEGVAGVRTMQGGMPAVVGRGRCVPDPRDDHADRFLAQVCVQTDAEQHIERVLVENGGEVHPQCQCTSGDGTLQPTTSVIVRFYDSPADCGAAFETLPDGNQGCWLDAAPDGVASPAGHPDAQPAPMSWNDEVRFGLPDRDLFAIDIDSLAVARAVSGVGTVIYGLAVQPGSGRVFAANTEAQNLTRFEGAGAAASTTVQGHLHESRLSIVDGESVTPVHLNDHIDYGRCCARDADENAQSLALPTSLGFSPDGKDLYFTALGSDRVAIVAASELGPDFHNTTAREHGGLRDVKIGSDDAPAGPVGLAFDAARGTLYVKTHFSNELVAIDPDAGEVVARVALPSPEPPSITRGRPILYDTSRTSAHGDSSCASCHVFANFDGLAWDLGDPDIPSAKNPGPMAQGAALFGLSGVVRDPFSAQVIGRKIIEDFRSNKGPMTTQTLRGLANHGAQHWRGDRSRRFQDLPGAQPDTGSLDEHNSFGEFDAAIVALNGNDAPLPAELFQDFTNFALQLTLPPNPVRALDNGLSPQQSRARANFFGCASMSDEQFERGTCIALDGDAVDVNAETRACACSKNPLLGMLRDLPAVSRFLGPLQPLLGDGERRQAVVQATTTGTDLPPDHPDELAQLGQDLDAAFLALAGVELGLDDESLLPAAANEAVRAVSAALGALRAFSRERHLDLLRRLYDALLAADAGTGSLPPGTSSSTLANGFDLMTEVGRVNDAVLADRAALGTGAHRDLLEGCDIDGVYTCRLRVVDTVSTCHGCHTLDRRGNAQFDVYRPGFFGTSGMYSFESESQIFKIPHLRNAYTKVGMFGVSSNLFLTPNSVLGDRRGGFPSFEGVFMGEQVRGFGFLHDGSVDTMHHFFGSAPFAARPPGTVSRRDPGNPTAFQSVLPAPDSRAACVAEFRAISDARFAEMPPGLELCRANSPIPDVCFLDPSGPVCTPVLAELAAQRGEPGFAASFAASVRPNCFRMGSTLQSGAASGSCFPEGLRDRTDMEAFVLAFDTNLEPMVGQQITIHPSPREAPPLLESMLTVAARGGCDVAARQGAVGYLMTLPHAKDPDRSELSDVAGHRRRLSDLRRRAEPLTLTCYPPHPSQAEARRSAFSRARRSGTRTRPKPRQSQGASPNGATRGARLHPPPPPSEAAIARSGSGSARSDAGLDSAGNTPTPAGVSPTAATASPSVSTAAGSSPRTVPSSPPEGSAQSSAPAAQPPVPVAPHASGSATSEAG
jgi:hypothetical protein